MEDIKIHKTVQYTEDGWVDYNKPIWPDYDLKYDDYKAGVESWVRKANDKGEWYLIPVRLRWDFVPHDDKDFPEEREQDNVKQTNQLLQIVKLFTERCYRVQLLYVLPEDESHVTDIRGHKIEELDKDQRTEQERLKLKYEQK
jgi:hypothetical protein